MSAPAPQLERILVILPTYNEIENVLDLSRDVLAEDPRLDVLVVDDASPDGTGDAVEGAMQSEPRLKLLRRAGKRGLGTAYLAGFRYGLEHGYDAIFTMDCDYSNHPRYLPAMLEMLGERDMVIGSRYVPEGGVDNWPWHRRMLSSFANFYARTLLRLPVRDCTAGFRGYRREVLETVDPFAIRSSGYSFLEEMAFRVHRCGYSIGEVPIIFVDRRLGISKIESREIYLAAWLVLVTALRPPKLPRREAKLAGRPAPVRTGSR